MILSYDQMTPVQSKGNKDTVDIDHGYLAYKPPIEVEDLKFKTETNTVEAQENGNIHVLAQENMNERRK